jgi:hypothetical protein
MTPAAREKKGAADGALLRWEVLLGKLCLESCFQRSHDARAAGAHTRAWAGEAVEVAGIPVAQIEGEWRLVIEAKGQADVPIGVVKAALAQFAPLVRAPACR